MSEGNCKEQVFRDWHNYPCSRKAWKDGYCKQHHPDSVKARDAERTRKWEVKKEESPYRKIETLNADLTALRAENDQLKAIVDAFREEVDSPYDICELKRAISLYQGIAIENTRLREAKRELVETLIQAEILLSGRNVPTGFILGMIAKHKEE
jgi:hypothetical protein